MLDKRFKYSLRLTSPFYIFRKYKKSNIFYVRFKNGKTVSTRKTSIQEAYDFAINYTQVAPETPAKNKTQTIQTVLCDYFTDGSKWLDYDRIHGISQSAKDLKTYCFYCRQAAELLADVSNLKNVTKARLHRLQEQFLQLGLSGKSVNNRMSVLHRVFKQLLDKEMIDCDPFNGLRNCYHEKQRRTCFPLAKFNGYFSSPDKMDDTDLLAYCAIVTGARRSELAGLRICDIEKYKDIHILRIHGTKSEYSDRTVPLSEKAVCAIKLLVQKNIASGKKIDNCTKIIGNRIGYSPEQIKNEGIVFHSFRKMYKTILTAANLNTSLVEMLMGHATDNQSSNNVERIYFVAEKAEMLETYKKVLQAFEFLDSQSESLSI